MQVHIQVFLSVFHIQYINSVIGGSITTFIIVNKCLICVFIIFYYAIYNTSLGNDRFKYLYSTCDIFEFNLTNTVNNCSFKKHEFDVWVLDDFQAMMLSFLCILIFVDTSCIGLFLRSLCKNSSKLPIFCCASLHTETIKISYIIYMSESPN